MYVTANLASKPLQRLVSRGEQKAGDSQHVTRCAVTRKKGWWAAELYQLVHALPPNSGCTLTPTVTARQIQIINHNILIPLLYTELII